VVKDSKGFLIFHIEGSYYLWKTHIIFLVMNDVS